MHFQSTIYLGLLTAVMGPSSGPQQCLVLGSPMSGIVEHATRAVLSREVSWSDKDKIEKTSIKNQEPISKYYDEGKPLNTFKGTTDKWGDIMFKQDMRTLEREVNVYKKLEGRGIAPEFFGLITENGKITGFVTELLKDGKKPSEDDQENCEKTLEKFHDRGLVHNDLHLGNFLVEDGRCYIIDFGFTEASDDEDLFELEMEVLAQRIDA